MTFRRIPSHATLLCLLAAHAACAAPAAAQATAPAPAISRDAKGQVSLACPAPGATLRYSLDGSEPNSDAATYLAPFPLPGGGTVKARAFLPDGSASPVTQAAFTAVAVQAAATPVPVGLPPSAKGVEYFNLRNGLANCRAQFEGRGKDGQKTGRIAFVGGSITFNGGWRDALMAYFRAKFPDTRFEFIAAGIPSVGSVGHAFRLEEDVLAKGRVDLVFVEAAVNDHNHDDAPGKEALARRGMEGVVRQLREKSPLTDVVEMHFVHHFHLPVWKEGKTPWTIAEHEKVAAHYGAPSLDLSKEVAQRIADGQFTWGRDFRDLHPSPFGQKVYAHSMVRMLDAAFAVPSAAQKPHPLPENPLDEASFARGRHGKLEDAILIRGFALEKNWAPKVRQQTRPGYAHCPALVADAAGAEFSYTFEGRGFGLFLAAGKDSGIIAYRTDGGPEKILDTRAPWSGALHLPWPLMLETDLAPGKHTVTVRTTDKAQGRAALHVIHVLLN